MANEIGRKLEHPGDPESPELERESVQTPSVGRRRLIKGMAAGLPLVFTLRSGTAMAMTTLGCMHDYTKKKPPVAIIPQQGPDPGGTSWLRQELRVRLVKRLDLQGQPVGDGLNPQGKPMGQAFKIYQAIETPSPHVWYTATGDMISLIEVHTLRELPHERGAAFVEYNGRYVDIVRVSPQKGGGRPITTSCWTSFVVRPTQV
jgi:hypothetical protein